MSETGTPQDLATTVEGLRTEVAQLRDLFARRLMEDKARNSLYETVQAQAKASQDLLKSRIFESLFRELLLALDRLESETLSSELVESFVDELSGIFERRGLVRVDDTGTFDSRVHEIVNTIGANDGSEAGAIVAVHRTGYQLGDRLLRPTQVTVAIDAGDGHASL